MYVDYWKENKNYYELKNLNGNIIARVKKSKKFKFKTKYDWWLDYNLTYGYSIWSIDRKKISHGSCDAVEEAKKSVETSLNILGYKRIDSKFLLLGEN